MENKISRLNAQLQPFSNSRREFLVSAVGAGLATTLGGSDLKARQISADTVLRVGLIGRDGHTEILLGSIPKLKNVQWTAYAKSRPDEDAAWVRKNAAAGQTRVYENYEQMLEKEELDVVGVCLPYYQNAEASIHAAGKGIHILSEKPAATSLADLARLEQEVRRSGVHYSIMLDMRTQPIFQAARKAVQVGAVGEPILISSQKSYKWGAKRPWFYQDRKTYGGTIPWVGIHAIDYMRWVSGQEYAAVAAFEGNKVHPQTPGCEDHASVLFRLASGGSATCHLDFLRPEAAATHGDDRLRIAGSDGVLEAMEVGNRVTLISTKGRGGELPLPPAGDFFSNFVAELRDEGKGWVSTDEAFSITRVCLRARDAADSGAWVAL